MTGDRTIKKQYQIHASRTAVFAAWLSNDYTVPPVARVFVEPEVGGKFYLYMADEAGSGVMQGRFTEFRPDDYLEYSWSWDDAPNASTVSVQFLDEGHDCLIELEHSGFDNDDTVAQHSAGWDAYIAGLAAQLA